jgi:hypothetical protein
MWRVRLLRWLLWIAGWWRIHGVIPFKYTMLQPFAIIIFDVTAGSCGGMERML